MERATAKRFGIILAALIAIVGGILVMRGTFATQVTYSGNAVELVGDKFDVALEYLNNNSYVSLFGDTDPFSDASKWCPGRSEIVYLKLSNNEAFPINYTLTLDVTDTQFDDQFQYAVLPKNLFADNTQHPGSWAEFVQATNAQAKTLSMGKHELMPEKTQLLDGDSGAQYIALCIHMNEDTDSSYQNKQLAMHFTLRLDADYKPGEKNPF